MIHLLYVTEAAARDAGMTHEGRMFGVPAWLAVTGENEVVGCPKVTALQLWCMAVDALMEAATYFIPADVCVETPIYIGRRI